MRSYCIFLLLTENVGFDHFSEVINPFVYPRLHPRLHPCLHRQSEYITAPLRISFEMVLGTQKLKYAWESRDRRTDITCFPYGARKPPRTIIVVTKVTTSTSYHCGVMLTNTLWDYRDQNWQ